MEIPAGPREGYSAASGWKGISVMGEELDTFS
jgi:hypothetical protein